MPDLHDALLASQTAGPFSGRVSFADVAAHVKSADLGDDPPTMRARFAQLLLGRAAEREPPVGTFARLGGIETWRIEPQAPEQPHRGPGDHCIVWFHGGGYVFGSPATHWRPAARLAHRTGLPVVLPRYRLAPEHPWPAPFEDALTVVEALRAAGARVILVGDSAGGHLALVTALALARAGCPAEALLVFSPNTDRTGRSTTRATSTDPMNDDAQDSALARLAFPNHAADDPAVSPLLDDLGLLPPTCVEVGGREVLFDDARLLADGARAAGVDVSLHVDPEAFHLWQVWTPWLAEAATSLERAASFIGQRMADAPIR